MRHLIAFFVLISIILLFACKGGEENVSVPADIIQPDSMIGILVDFHLVEAAISDKQQQKKNVAYYTDYYYQEILKKHQISRVDLDKAFDFYSYHPKLYREIYDQVLSELSRLQSQPVSPGKQ